MGSEEIWNSFMEVNVIDGLDEVNFIINVYDFYFVVWLIVEFGIVLCGEY